MIGILALLSLCGFKVERLLIYCRLSTTLDTSFIITIACKAYKAAAVSRQLYASGSKVSCFTKSMDSLVNPCGGLSLDLEPSVQKSIVYSLLTRSMQMLVIPTLSEKSIPYACILQMHRIAVLFRGRGCVRTLRNFATLTNMEWYMNLCCKR